MRVIFYLLDGVSALKVRSCNSDEVNAQVNANIPETYIDELYRAGTSVRYCYGFDNTQSSLYAAFTGHNHSHSKVSITRYGDLLMDFNDTLASRFMKKGYRTVYFSNNCVENKSIIYDGFSEIYHDHENYDLSQLSSHIPNSIWQKGKDNFIFVHDFYTHDQNGQYSKGKFCLSSEEYETLIVKHAEIIKTNLAAMEFDPEKDYLILASDHGLTVDSDVFKNPGTCSSFWSLNSKELKARTLFSIIGPEIPCKENVCIGSMLDIYPTVTKLFALGGSGEGRDIFEPVDGSSALSLNYGNAAVALPSKYCFHQFFYVTRNDDNDRVKYIYQDNILLGEMYNITRDPLEKKPTEVSFEQLPTLLQEYITTYQESRLVSWKVIVAVLNNYFNKSAILFRIRNWKSLFKIRNFKRLLKMLLPF